GPGAAGLLAQAFGAVAGLLADAVTFLISAVCHLTAASALRVAADHGPLPAPALVAALLEADEETWRDAVID
ncbi:hypothetical protein ACWEMN_50155, partial [Streptomyces mirabilis]